MKPREKQKQKHKDEPRAAFLLIFTILFFSACLHAQTEASHFSNLRDVHIRDAGKQNFFAIDEEIWQHSRPDLGDLRLFTTGGREVPYSSSIDWARTQTQQSDAHLLQLGSAAGRTTFFLDAAPAEEYNRIILKLKTKNFIARASVDGMDDIHARQSTHLGVYTLYDFTRENLGSNFAIQLPTASRFRFLHITLSKEVPRDDVQSASIAYRLDKKAGYTAIGASPSIRQDAKSKNTIARWTSAEQVPLERVEFQVAPGEINFMRPVHIEDKDGRAIAAGQISRIHLVRDGKLVDSENLAVDICCTSHSTDYTATIENGDDPPLHLNAVRPMFVSRKFYFAPQGESELKLYYGYPKLAAPTYDYAKLFQEELKPAEASLGPGGHNPGFTGYPDDRPWSERHPAVLWIALLLAVAGLGGLALRGLKTQTAG